MAQIEWDNSLSVGIDLIDEQHKMLIQRLNDLSKAVEMMQGEAEITKTLEFMIDYTNFHFSSEEEYMAKEKYSGLDDQQKQHEEFKNILKDLVEDFEEEGPTRALTTSINTFLVNWLKQHIKGLDLQFGNFLKDKDSAT
ncbi:MAG: bacteriohemerythrin [Planctomycetota bacterium]|jgi:hemerythrin